MRLLYEVKVNPQAGKMPYREMVSNMDKEQVVELMTETIINLNVSLAKQNNIPQEQIDQMIELSTSQFNTLNGILYDVLKENGAFN